jgi:hypothetical protein
MVFATFRCDGMSRNPWLGLWNVFAKNGTVDPQHMVVPYIAVDVPYAIPLLLAVFEVPDRGGALCLAELDGEKSLETTRQHGGANWTNESEH